MTLPGIDFVRFPSGATDLVLLVHGGMERSRTAAHAWRPAMLRMWPFAWAARSSAPDAAVGLLRYRYRGWNGAAADAASDLRAVLSELPPGLRRVVLVGHSMGGRAVVAAGAHPRVAGVLALAPWLPPGEPLTPLRPPVTFAHGTADTVTDPAATAAYATRLRTAGTPVTVYSLSGETHAMLRRASDWNRLVADFVRSAMEEPAPAGPALVAEELPADGARTSTAAAVGQIAAARVRLPVRQRYRVGPRQRPGDR